MKVVSSDEMRRIDRCAIEDYGMPAVVLMAQAGRAVAEYITRNFSGTRKAAVFCGTGNNGGDGFVAAYLLHNSRIPVEVYLTGDGKKTTETAAIYLKLCEKSKVPLHRLASPGDLDAVIPANYDLIVDALLGTGFSGTLRGMNAHAVNFINRSGIRVVSVDIPSGLPSDGAGPEGEAVRAYCTITIGLPKISLVTFPGKQYAGILEIADIGFPRELTAADELSHELADRDYCTRHLAVITDYDSHKGERGHLLLAGGFDGMEGAAMMSAMAAMETGTGLATLITTYKARSIIAGKIPELITREIDAVAGRNKPGRMSELSDESIDCRTITEWCDAFFSEERVYRSLVLGPGLGRHRISREFFRAIIAKLPGTSVKRALIDGDGLFHLYEYLGEHRLPEGIDWIITPHFGEAARLLDMPVSNIRKNRIDAAKLLARKSSAITVLKGPATIVTDGKSTLINTSGNSALATGGTGDVLSGIMGALMLRKDLTAFESAGIAAYLHGRSADLMVEKNGVAVLKATDVISGIRNAMLF